jgi:predicted DsbA family dithiol-disulfide isomerase
MTNQRLIIDVVADIVCPWCYVGVKSYLAARETLNDDFDIVTRFRPYQLDPNTPADGVDRHAYYRQKFPDPEQLAAGREAIRENARLAGFSFDPSAPPRLPNTLKAHQLIRLAHFTGRQEQATLAIYRAFWDELKDIGDNATLVAIAGVVGIDDGLAAAALGSEEDAAMVEAEAESFRNAGVAGVPTFIVNERTGFSGGMPPDTLAAALRRAADMTSGALQ